MVTTACKLQKAKLHISPILFIFSIMFSVEIAGIDTRYFVLLFWLFYCFVKSQKVKMPLKVFFVPLCISCLIIYALFIMLVYRTDNSFEVLRLFRVILTFIIILSFISLGVYSRSEIYKALEFVLLLHAMSVILSVIFPSIRVLLLPISQYSKTLYSFRATGLVSGYDNAGYLCNAGLVVNYLINKENKRERCFGLKALIFVAAALLTARFSMLFTALLMTMILLRESKTRSLKGKLLVYLIVAVVGIIVFLFWILTTNTNIGIRDRLFRDYPILINVYEKLMSSYTDYGKYTSVISNQWRPATISLFEALFGVGYRPNNSDIGYVKTIFSIGVVGVIAELYIYIKTFFVFKSNISARIAGTNRKSLIEYTRLYGILLLLMLLMEFKMSFIFATTTCEMLFIVFLNEIIGFDKQKYL